MIAMRAAAATLFATLAGCAVGDAVRGRDAADDHDKTALMYAAERGDSLEAERLLARGAKVNQQVRPHSGLRVFAAFIAFMQQLPQRNEGYTALHYALQNRHLGVARALLRRGASPAASDRRAWSLAYTNGLAGLELFIAEGVRPVGGQADYAVRGAAAARDTIALALLFRHGASPDGDGGETPLMYAARTGDSVLVRVLLDAGASRTAREPHTGWTPAMIARDAGHLEIADRIGGPEDAGALRDAEFARAVQRDDGPEIERLLAAGASPNAQTQFNDPVLLVAVRSRNLRLAERLLAAGADPNVRQYGQPVLVTAAQMADSALVSLLLDAGADPRTPGVPTAAAAAGAVDLLRLLRSRGADLREAGDEPLRAAAGRGSPDAVRLLLAHGADPRAVDPHGRDPLGAAVTSRRLEVVALLLDAGAETDRAGDRWTPLMGAAIAGDSAMVELLLARGANRHARSEEGRTPAEIARRAGHERLARRLGG